jgi:ubiquinone/menaquinone biosynthesis C-methylase UbiE
MSSKSLEVGSEAYKEVMAQAYGEPFLKIIDLVGRKDFYGVMAEEGIAYLAEKLNLSAESYLLELCSGIGGPLRYLVKKYGCKAAGIEINEFSHQVALERTKKAGLEGQINFICGNALDIPFPEATFTHVFGCDAWSYFPNKLELYQGAYRVLKPSGIIAFYDLAKESERERPPSHWEAIFGSYHPETFPRYEAMLKETGFSILDHEDSSSLANKESLKFLNSLIKNREEVLKVVGSEPYYQVLETWAEILADIHFGQVKHCYFIAQKGS